MLLWPYLLMREFNAAEIRMKINKSEQIRLGPGQPDRSVYCNTLAVYPRVYQGRAASSAAVKFHEEYDV